MAHTLHQGSPYVPVPTADRISQATGFLSLTLFENKLRHECLTLTLKVKATERITFGQPVGAELRVRAQEEVVIRLGHLEVL